MKKEKYSFLERIDVSCIQGYSLLGQRTFSCQNNGSWNGTMPTCQGKLFKYFLTNPTL